MALAVHEVTMQSVCDMVPSAVVVSVTTGSGIHNAVVACMIGMLSYVVTMESAVYLDVGAFSTLLLLAIVPLMYGRLPLLAVCNQHLDSDASVAGWRLYKTLYVFYAKTGCPTMFLYKHI